ncbi:MAG: hypothetical protein J6B41_02920 [Alistipes sp.]|nr:hypothetical protein [Alistipes sp.]
MEHRTEDKMTIKSRKEQTFLVMWNRNEPHFTMNDFDQILADWGEANNEKRIVWPKDNQAINSGDWFYIIDSASKPQGIALVGQVIGVDDEASAKIELKAMFHPEHSPMLYIDEMKAHLKGVDWSESVAMKLLTEPQTERLGKIWRAFIANNRDLFRPRAVICDEWYEEQRQASLIDRAIALAVEAHSSDIDLDGNPTILHALSVGMAGESDNEKIAGFLHDVVEDTPYTFEDIAAEGFDDNTMEALHLLTHDKQIPYMEYIAKICNSGNKTAINVKLNDLNHNLKRGSEGGHLQFRSKHLAAREYIENYQARTALG